ncbi:Transcriptional regulator, IclR family [hydrothermal vent metagenome]|uniref:Transcriptional regulator, IclR family n=1 Tax=hydrothermal vent metagenome TaxID=652676 RepID=A0A3B0V1S1_9ZZZZ
MSEIKSLARGLQIIHLLADKGDAVSVTEVSKRLAIDKSSASRLIKTLVKYEFAERDKSTRRFRLGNSVRKLASPQSNHALLKEISLPFLRQLVAQTGENAHLAVNLGDAALVIADVESTEALRVVSEVGRQERLYCTAVGKCLLAFGNSVIPTELPRLTQYTITDRLKLERHLEAIRNQGYAVDDEEKTIGIRCLSAPVYDVTQKAIASIGISGPALRLTPAKVHPLAEIVMQEAVAFSKILGYIP